MKRTVILGVGGYLPERVVTNDELAGRMETNDAWIFERTGIRERRWISQETPTSELGEKAARQALERAGVSAQELDAIILATLSPDVTFPGSGCFLQDRLGLTGIPALDVRMQCSGFLYGLSVADAWIRTGQYTKILLVGCEIHSTGLNIQTAGRDTACLFGDGGGAVVLGAQEGRGDRDDRGVFSTHLHADGRYAKSLWTEAPGSGFYPARIDQRMLAEGRQFPKMNGRHVFTSAVQRLPEVIQEGLRFNGLLLSDVDLVVPHQANQRINEMVAQVLKLPPEKMFSNIEKIGNTTAASIPLALRDAEDQGRIRRGSLVVLASFGAGFSWASAVLRW